MSSSISSAQAYDRLSLLTDQFNEGQARLQELRLLSRALRAVAMTYANPDNVELPMGQAIVRMTEVIGIERNRLYVEQKRQVQEMDTLTALVQNGAFYDGNN